MAYRLGQFDLSPETRLLVRSGDPVSLTPKAFDLLELLVRRRPFVVTKDEIQDALWPDTYVVEANIANLVREIRAALGDSARGSRYVRTVPRHGYAFVEPVTEFTVTSRAMAAVSYRLVGDEHAFVLTEGEHLVGRGGAATLVVRHATVSRRHALVAVRGRSVTIEDLGSRNGTFVEGRRLSGATALTPGCEIHIGAVPLRLQLVEPTLSTATASVPAVVEAPATPRVSRS